MDQKTPLQQIILNRTRFNSIEFTVRHAEMVLPRGMEHEFIIELVNYGAPTRVYLAPSHEIGEVIKFLQNDLVADGKTVIRGVACIDTQQNGRISVTIGYGANTGSFDLEMIADSGPQIDVDPSLAIPASLSGRTVSQRAPMTPAMSAIGVSIFILATLSLLGMLPSFVGVISAILLLVLLITYAISPHIG